MPPNGAQPGAGTAAGGPEPGSTNGDGAAQGRRYPELPPDIGDPPEVDVGRARRYLQHWADRYAVVGYPDEHADTAVPLRPERGAEALHAVDQQRALQWCKKAGGDLEAMRGSVSAQVGQARDEADEFDGELSDVKEELEQHQAAVTASAPADRFGTSSRWLRQFALAIPVFFVIPEYLIIDSAVGRVLGVTGGALVPTVAALSLSQIALAELTGGLIRRCLVSPETTPVRRAEVAATGLCALLLLMSQAGIVLARWGDTGGGGGFLLLAAGTQFAVVAMSGVLGYVQVDPAEVASRRSLANRVAELQDERDDAVARETDLRRELEGLEGLIAGWPAWSRRHQVAVQKQYAHELSTFRARLTDGLSARGLNESVYVLGEIAEPVLDIPIQEAGLDEDDDLLDAPPTLNLGP